MQISTMYYATHIVQPPCHIAVALLNTEGNGEKAVTADNIDYGGLENEYAKYRPRS